MLWGQLVCVVGIIEKEETDLNSNEEFENVVHLGCSVRNGILFTFHWSMLVCISHRAIFFGELGTRTGDMHTKETGLGVMFHLGLPARRGKKDFACFTTHFMDIRLEVTDTLEGGYTSSKDCERRVLYGPCYDGKWKCGGLKPVCGRGNGRARGGCGTASCSLAKGKQEICMQGGESER